MTGDSKETQDQFVPEKVRNRGIGLSLLFSGLLVVYYLIYILGLVEASPRDLGLSNLLLFSLICFLFFAVPWLKLSPALRRFGPLEFERKLEGQSEERIREISALEDRIAEIEARLDHMASPEAAVQVSRSQTDDRLRILILEFFFRFDRMSLSPRRLETWGAQQPGFEGLARNPALLRQLLRRLVVENRLETTVSEAGTTLYRLKTPSEDPQGGP